MWSRRGADRWRSSLEASLRSQRREAPADFVHHLSERVVAARTSPRWGSRIAFAAGVSTFIVGTFASFGGLSYAASGATGTYGAVKQIVVVHKLKVAVHTSSAASQYPHLPKKKPSAVFKPPKVSPKPAALAAVQVNGGTLPFTGFSLLGTLVVSLALIGAGIFLRRRERRS
jgi:hypothetical protein